MKTADSVVVPEGIATGTVVITVADVMGVLMGAVVMKTVALQGITNSLQAGGNLVNQFLTRISTHRKTYSECVRFFRFFFSAY